MCCKLQAVESMVSGFPWAWQVEYLNGEPVTGQALTHKLQTPEGLGERWKGVLQLVAVLTLCPATFVRSHGKPISMPSKVDPRHLSTE